MSKKNIIKENDNNINKINNYIEKQDLDKYDNNENNKFKPIKPYLIQTVIPVIQKGLIELDKNRPENPLEYLGKYLISNSNH